MRNNAERPHTTGGRSEIMTPPDATKRVAIFAAAFISTFSAFSEKMHAAVTCEQIRPGESLTLRYQRSEKEKPELLMVVPLDDLNKNFSDKPVHSVLMDSIRSVDVKLPSIDNTPVYQNKEFIDFLNKEYDEIVKEKEWSGIPNVKKSKWGPAIVCKLGVKILFRNFRYDRSLNPYLANGEENPSYNKQLRERLDSTPIDQLMQDRRGVCPHAARKLTEIVKGLCFLSKSPALQNFYIDEIDSFSLNNAWNVVYNVTEDPGTGIVARMAFIETAYGNADQSRVDRTPLYYTNALNKQHTGVEEGFMRHVFPILTTDEQREALKAIYEFRETGTPNIHILRTILDSYDQDIVVAKNKGQEQEGVRLERDKEEFLKKAEAVLDSFSDSGLSAANVKESSFIVLRDGYIILGAVQKSDKMFQKLFEAIDVKEFLLKFKTGEDLANTLASHEKVDEAVKVYEVLFELYQSEAGKQHQTYEVDSEFFGWKIKAQPFADEHRFREYIEQKKQEWKKKYGK